VINLTLEIAGRTTQAAFILQDLGEQFNMKMSLIEIKLIAFKSEYPIYCKINSLTLEKILDFSYKGNDVSYKAVMKTIKWTDYREYVAW